MIQYIFEAEAPKGLVGLAAFLIYYRFITLGRNMGLIKKTWKSYAVVVFIILVYAFYYISSILYSSPPVYGIEKFPLLTQPDGITCGPACATMLLRYYKRDVDIGEVKYKIKTTWFTYKNKSVGMSIPSYIKSTLDGYGVESQVKRGNIQELQYNISQNRPPIILLRSDVDKWHYVVAIGYDKDTITIADPADGSKYKMPLKCFLGAWDFSSDIQGNYIGNDFYRFLILMGEIQSKTYIVPKFSAPK